MNNRVLILGLVLMLSCQDNKIINENELFELKVEAFHFLSENHHQLHILIGEEEGDKRKAFLEFKKSPILQHNKELIPVKNALGRIHDVDIDSVYVKRLDDLVDYYQSGLSIQIEAFLRGYGYKENVVPSSYIEIYDKIKID